MNEIFNFHGQEVRTVIFDNEPWFVAKDVADILGYQNGSRDINRHVDEDDKLTSQVATAGQMRNQTVINESGLYSLIQQVASGQGVQTLGDIRGFASYSQAGWIYPRGFG